MATTSTRSRKRAPRASSQFANACAERPGTMSSSLAGAPSARGVRSTITVTYRSPDAPWRHTCSSTPMRVTRAYGSDRDRIRIPWARTARSSAFHEQPSVRAHADIDADSNATRRNAQSTAARDSSVRPDTNAFKSSCHMRAHVTHS